MSWWKIQLGAQVKYRINKNNTGYIALHSLDAFILLTLRKFLLMSHRRESFRTAHQTINGFGYVVQQIFSSLKAGKNKEEDSANNICRGPINVPFK